MGSWTESYLRSFAALNSHNFMIFFMEDSMAPLKENASQRERGHRELRTRLLIHVPDLVNAFGGKAHVFQVGINQDGLQPCSSLPGNAAEAGGQNSFRLACL